MKKEERKMFDRAKLKFNSQVILPIERYTELVKKETQLEFVKKLLKAKNSYNNYIDVSDLKVLLEIEEMEGATGE